MQLSSHIASGPITVIMATYNGGRFLEKQLDSILAQTLPPEEILVCDDCSNDNTHVILTHYQQQGKLRFFVNETRLGVVENFRKAASLAREGNYIAFADQDDIWLPDKLEKSAARLKEIDNGDIPALVYSDLHVINDQGNLQFSSFWQMMSYHRFKHSLNTLLFVNYVLGCTILMNHAMAKEFIRIPYKGRLSHDAWLAHIAYSFGKVSCIQEPLVLYRKHDQNVSFGQVINYTFWQKIKRNLRSVSNNHFIVDQLQLVELFYTTYRDKLSGEPARLIRRFLHLKNKPYLYQRLFLEIFFYRHWTKGWRRLFEKI